MKVNLDDIELMENSRREIIDVHCLMESIKTIGLLNPVNVAINPNRKGKRYVLIAGNRRYHAVKKLGNSSIEATLIQTENLNDARFINLAENIQRENTTPYEQGSMMNLLIQDGYTPKEIAARLNVATNYVKDCLIVFNRTPAKYRNKIGMKGVTKEPNKIPMTVAKKIENINELSGSNKLKLYDMADKGQITTTNIDYLYNFCRSQGAEKMRKTHLNDVVKSINEYVFTKPYLAVPKKTQEKLSKKYPDKSLISIIKDIIRGNIKEKIDLA